MLQTVRKEKVDEKLGSFASFPCFLSKLWSFNCQKSAFFLSLLKEFTYMHQKVLIILFEKMISFIGVWATVHELLSIKIFLKNADSTEI